LAGALIALIDQWNREIEMRKNYAPILAQIRIVTDVSVTRRRNAMQNRP
jgi:hypothetical protein